MTQFTFEQTQAAVEGAMRALQTNGHEWLSIARAFVGIGAGMIAAKAESDEAIATLEAVVAEMQKILGAYHAATRPKGGEH